MDDEQEKLIRERAYEIWLAEGRMDGFDADHWERARRALIEEGVLIAHSPMSSSDALLTGTGQTKL